MIYGRAFLPRLRSKLPNCLRLVTTVTRIRSANSVVDSIENFSPFRPAEMRTSLLGGLCHASTHAQPVYLCFAFNHTNIDKKRSDDGIAQPSTVLQVVHPNVPSLCSRLPQSAIQSVFQPWKSTPLDGNVAASTECF